MVFLMKYSDFHFDAAAGGGHIFTKAFVKASVTLPLFALVGVEAQATGQPTNNIPSL